MTSPSPPPSASSLPSTPSIRVCWCTSTRAQAMCSTRQSRPTCKSPASTRARTTMNGDLAEYSSDGSSFTSLRLPPTQTPKCTLRSSAQEKPKWCSSRQQEFSASLSSLLMHQSHFLRRATPRRIHRALLVCVRKLLNLFLESACRRCTSVQEGN
jgi:hypothetical protein